MVCAPLDDDTRGGRACSRPSGEEDEALPSAYQAMEDLAQRLVVGEPPLDRFAISFHLMEICGGTGGLSRAAGARGLSVGPNVELKKEMDVLDPNVFGWVRWSILRGRIYCLVVEPPCTTDSLARCPKLRSSWTPNGFDPLHLQTLTGNTISAACLYLALMP